MIYHRILLTPGEADGNGGNLPPIEAKDGGDMATAMVAEMEALSKNQSPTPAEAPAAPSSAPAPKQPEPPAKAPEPQRAQPQPAPKAQAPAPKPTAQPPKPAATQPKPAAPAPTSDQKLDWASAPAQFRAAHERLLQVHQEESQRLTSELQTTQAKMRELEGRKFLSPEQEQRYANLEKDQLKLQAELYARDYEQSPEFKEKFDAKAAQVYRDMDIELKGMTVNAEDGQKRQATRADFQKVAMAAFQSRQAAIKVAKEIFSDDDAQIVLDGAKSLVQIQRDGQAAIESKRTAYQADRQNQEKQFQRELEEGRQTFAQYDSLIESKFPQYFGPQEGNDAYNKAREEGLKYIDSTSTNLHTKTPQERAFQTALMRRWAAAFPATQVLLKQRDEKIALLEAQIAKLKGTDPGELGGDGQRGGGDGSEIGGTDGLAGEIETMTKEN